MSAVAHQRVQAGPVALHVAIHGDADAPRGDLLLLPGITSPAGTWAFVAEPLAALGWRVVVLDQRGRGLSDAPATGYGLEDYAADAACVIERLGLRQPVVLGHSMGARIAAALAIGHPGLAGPLVLADPPLTGPGRPPYPMPLSFYLDAIAEARSGLTLAQARAQEPSWDDDRLRDRIRWLSTCDAAAVAESYRGFHDEDFLALWAQLDAPALVHGTRSLVVGPADADDLRARSPSARIVAVDGAGHMIPWDDLDGFVAAIEEAVDYA
jgi:N-formylmaleamate deformylase